MAREEKPLEYLRRLRDTKGVAQRLDLGYLNRPRLLAVWRARLTWLLVAGAALVAVPLVLGLGGSRRVVANGPLSQAHALFVKRCEVCHERAFGGVPDRACRQCHDGAAHPASLLDSGHANATPACVQCHLEHGGKALLAEVGSANCTSCHNNLRDQAAGVKLRGVEITAFRTGSHAEFSTATGPADGRPLRLNHAIHMPAQPKTIRGIKLPMQCADCHVTDRASTTGALLPVAFEANCKSCHARELEFDVYRVLGPAAAPAPHTKDPQSTRVFIWNAYQSALADNPRLALRPVGNDLAPAANWLERVTTDSLAYLFQRKCAYCHEMSAPGVVRKVNRVAGRYAEALPQGEPWWPRAEFAHRDHRAVECESCHVAARTSSRTADVLIPAMKSCLPCHGESGAGLDRCSLCHLYHNRALEKDRQRRPTEQLVEPGDMP